MHYLSLFYTPNNITENTLSPWLEYSPLLNMYKKYKFCIKVRGINDGMNLYEEAKEKTQNSKYFPGKIKIKMEMQKKTLGNTL